MLRKFCVTLDRDGIQSDIYWLHIVSMSYGLCSIPDNTTCWDIEYFDDVALLTIECTREHFYIFLKNLKGMFPIKYSYEEVS